MTQGYRKFAYAFSGILAIALMIMPIVGLLAGQG